jgi:putative inorganic carbon (HCO3(-)) transporter
VRDYVLTAFIVAILPACFFRPWLGIVAWFWFGLMNPHRQTWDFAVSMPFASLIGGATLLGMLVARDRRPIPWNRELVLIAVLMVYFSLTSMVAWAPDFAWMQWLKVFKIVLMTVLATMFIYGKERIRLLMLTIVFSIGFYGVKSFFWVLRSGGLNRVEGPAGTFMDGNTFLGLAFNMVIPLMIFMAREEQKPWLKRTLYVMAAMTVLSTIFTYSRGAFIGLALIIPLMYLRSQQKVLAACILIPAMLAAPFVLPDQISERADLIENYEGDKSAIQRLQSWAVAWNIAKDRPLTGAGFEFEYGDPVRWYAYAEQKYLWATTYPRAAHSIYFQVLGQHGIVAALLYMGLLLGTLASLGRSKTFASTRSELSWIAIYSSGMQIAIVGYMVSGAFLSSAYFDLGWLFFALSAVLAREIRELKETSRGVQASARGVPAPLPAAGFGVTAVPRPSQVSTKTVL